MTAENSALIRQCDHEFSLLIHALFEERCAKCKAMYATLAPHHIIHRADKWTRHMIMNAVLLCQDCHEYAHAHPSEFMGWLSATWPGHYEFVQAHHWKSGHPDYAEILRVLKKVREQLQGK